MYWKWEEKRASDAECLHINCTRWLQGKTISLIKWYILKCVHFILNCLFNVAVHTIHLLSPALMLVAHTHRRVVVGSEF